MIKTINRLEQVVSIAEAREQSRIDDNCDDLLLHRYIGAAINYCENSVRRAIGRQEMSAITGCFEDSIKLIDPLESIVSVEYYDTNGILQTLPESLYIADSTTTPGRFIVAHGETLPDTQKRPDAVTINFIAGDAPDAIKHAIILLAAHWYEHRESAQLGRVESIPYGVDALLYPYRVYTL